MIANMNVLIKFEKFISKTNPNKDEKAARKCRLFVFLYKLRDSGSTILIVEHNLDVINCADYIIDLGPKGGSEGGYLQFMGDKEKFIKNPKSKTAEYLRKHSK